jgi:prolyl-tRNA synthetase
MEKSEIVRHAVDGLYTGLKLVNVDVILDDRGERPGVMFAEWELIGVPVRVTVGERGLKENQIEVLNRRSGVMTMVPVSGAVQAIKDILAQC